MNGRNKRSICKTAQSKIPPVYIQGDIAEATGDSGFQMADSGIDEEVIDTDAIMDDLVLDINEMEERRRS